MNRYGRRHRTLRLRMTPTVPGSLCVRCGCAIAAGDEWDLDHRDDGPGYLGPAHRSCNRSAGARRGNQQRKSLTMEDQVFAVAIALNRSHTSIIAAGKLDDGSTALEVVDYLAGTNAAPDVIALAAERDVTRCAIDPRSPAATLIAPLRELGLTVVEPNTHDLAVAHGGFLDGLRAGRLKYKAHPALTAAAQHADTRPLAGAEALERRHVEADASPLEAAELAAWLLAIPAPRPPMIYALQPTPPPTKEES